jgi:hypothetical protein
MPLQTMVRSLGWLAALIWFCPNLGYPQIHVIISVLFLNWQFWGCGVYPILGTLISAEDDRFLQWQICWKGKAHHGIWHVVQQRFFFSVVALGEAIDLHSMIGFESLRVSRVANEHQPLLRTMMPSQYGFGGLKALGDSFKLPRKFWALLGWSYRLFLLKW